MAAGVERPSFLSLIGEGTYESCKCDDISNDRLFSCLVVCNWNQEFRTHSDTPSLYCGFPEVGSCVATRLGGPLLYLSSLTTSKASEPNPKCPNQGIISSLYLFLFPIVLKLFLLGIPSCKLSSKWDPSSMEVLWDVLSFWFDRNLFLS